MKLIVTIRINGRVFEIWSDKTVASVTPAGCTFVDGSEVDIPAMRIKNEGAGTIEVRPITKKTVAFRFSAEKLRLSDLGPNVTTTIQPHAHPGILITATGSQEDIASLSISEEDDWAIVSGPKKPKKSYQGKGMSIEIGSLNAVNVNFGNQFTEQTQRVNDNPTVHLNIAVPVNQFLIIKRCQGDVTVGDTRSKLRVTSKGSNLHQFGKMESVDIDADEGTVVVVDEVHEMATVLAGSNANVQISKGTCNTVILSIGSGAHVFMDKVEIQKLNATVSAATFQLTGSAVSATLEANDSGLISVSHVDNRPDVKRNSGGKVFVANHPDV